MGNPHVMVLDTISGGNFIFKNTYADNKKVEMAVDAEEAPEEFFFVHIVCEKTSFKKKIKTAFKKISFMK